jgi:hypothetical protein
LHFDTGYWKKPVIFSASFSTYGSGTIHCEGAWPIIVFNVRRVACSLAIPVTCQFQVIVDVDTSDPERKGEHGGLLGTFRNFIFGVFKKPAITIRIAKRSDVIEIKILIT